MTLSTCLYCNRKNDSWSTIVQAFTEKKRIRPASAPNTRQELKARESVTINSTRCNRSNRVASAWARLFEIATQKDEPMPLFQRTAEIQAVVDLLQDTRVVRCNICNACFDCDWGVLCLRFHLVRTCAQTALRSPLPQRLPHVLTVSHRGNSTRATRGGVIGLVRLVAKVDIPSLHLPNQYNFSDTPNQQTRLRGKLKKGERRKAAEAAMRAESVLHPQPDRHHSAASSQSSFSVISGGTGSGLNRVPSAANGARRRRQRRHPASHSREHASPKEGSQKRQPVSKVREGNGSFIAKAIFRW